MTTDQILAMPPGPELDNALAPLLGYTVEHFDHELDGHKKHCTIWKTPDGASVNPIPLSTSWEGMRLITEAMAAKGWQCDLCLRTGWPNRKPATAVFWIADGPRFIAEADTAPESVAKAARLAMEQT